MSENKQEALPRSTKGRKAEGRAARIHLLQNKLL